MSEPPDDKAITLYDAEIEYGFPVSDLCHEAKRGTLEVFHNGKTELTTPGAIRRMIQRCKVEIPPRPEPVAVALYRHFDKAGILLYVGIAIDPLRRLAQHSLRAVWYRRIARIEIQYFPSRKVALEAEFRAIREEGPKFNIVGRPNA